MKAQITTTRSYKVILSTKSEIRVDADELNIIMAAAHRGALIRAKQGIINPAYIVAIVEDTERKAKFLEDTRYPQDTERRIKGLEPLKDIFENVPKLGQAAPKQIS